MNLDVDTVLKYFDLAILVMLALGALFGFLKGTFKSAYNFLVFTVLLITGWFLSPVFVRVLMNADISKVYEFSISSVEITSINASIPGLVDQFVPEFAGIVVPGSVAYATIQAFVFMALRIVVMILWLILMGTVFKFIFWLIYLAIRPKRKRGGKKIRTGLVSRFGGLGIGLAHALLVVFLFSIPFSGLTSIGTSLAEMLPEAQGEEVAELSHGQLASPELENFEEMLGFMAGYRETMLGKIAGAARIGGAPADEFFFDEFFSLRIEKPEVRVKLRMEMQAGLKAYALLTEHIEGDVSLEAIATLEEETIRDFLQEIKKLKLINVAVPIGVEYARKQGWIDFLDDVEFSETFSDLLTIDFASEFEHLGEAFFAAGELGLFGEGKEIDFYLSLDGEKIEALFASLGELETANLLGGIAVSYFLDQEGTRKFFEDFDVDPEELDLDDISWGLELANLGTLYKAFREMGLTLADGKPSFASVTDEGINSFSIAVFNSQLFSGNGHVFGKIIVSLLPDEYRSHIVVETFEKNDLVSFLSLAKVMDDAGLLGEELNYEILFSETNIEKIAEAICNSNLLSSNLSKLLKLLLEKAEIPFEISEESLERDWSGEAGKTEIKALFTAAGELFDLGLSDGNFFENLSAETIDNLTDKISASAVLMGNMGNLIDYLFSEDNTPGNFDIDTTSVQNLEWDSEAGRTEFKHIMRALAAIVEGKLHEEPDFKNLSDGSEDVNEDGVIDEKDNLIGRLAESFSGSILIRNNLNGIIKEITSGETGELKISTFEDPDEWTREEIEALLLSVKILSGKENIPEDLFNLTDDELDTVLRSMLLSRSLVENIEEMAAPGGKLEGHLITENVQEDAWYDRYEEGIRVYDGELRRLFVGGKTLLGDNPNFDDSENLVTLNRVLELDEEEEGGDLDKLLASKVLKDSFANKLIEKSKEENAEFEVNMEMNDPAWDGEIRHLLKAIKILLGEDANLDNPEINLNTVKNLSEDEIDKVLDSIIVSDTIIKKLVDIGADPEGSLVVRFEKTDPVWRKTDSAPGELKNFLTAAILLLDEEDNLNSSDAIKVSKIVQLLDEGEENIDTLSKSYLITDTAAKHLREMTAPGGSLYQVIYLPELTDDDYHGPAGEMKRFVLAADILLKDAGDDELENLEQIKLGTFAGENQKRMLASEIVKETIIRNIEIEAEKPGAVLKIAPELDRSASGYQQEAWNNELPLLLDAIIAILGEDATIDGLTVEEEDFLALEDSKIDTIVASRLVSYTAAKTIESNAHEEDSLITLPADLDPEEEDYQEEHWYGPHGELAKALRALRELGLASFDSDFRLQAVFAEARSDQEEVILASRVLEASFINKIKKEQATNPNLSEVLVIPEAVVWEKRPGDRGELRRFLVAIEIIIGDEELGTATFEVDRFLGDDQETLLASKVVEASAISYIQASDKLTIPNREDVGTYYYFESESLVWDGEDGELRRFLAGVKTLLGESSFEEFVFEMDNLMNVDFDIALKSRVLEATLTDMVLEMISEGGALHGMIKEPDNGYHWYHHADSEEPGVAHIRNGEYEIGGNKQYSDLSGFLKAVQAFSASGLDYNEITKEAIADANHDILSEAFCNHSRIINGSIATLLNYALKDVNHPLKPVFTDDDIDASDQDSVKDALWLFSNFVKSI